MDVDLKFHHHLFHKDGDVDLYRYPISVRPVDQRLVEIANSWDENIPTETEDINAAAQKVSAIYETRHDVMTEIVSSIMGIEGDMSTLNDRLSIRYTSPYNGQVKFFTPDIIVSSEDWVRQNKRDIGIGKYIIIGEIGVSMSEYGQVLLKLPGKEDEWVDKDKKYMFFMDHFIQKGYKVLYFTLMISLGKKWTINQNFIASNLSKIMFGEIHKILDPLYYASILMDTLYNANKKIRDRYDPDQFNQELTRIFNKFYKSQMDQSFPAKEYLDSNLKKIENCYNSIFDDPEVYKWVCDAEMAEMLRLGDDGLPKLCGEETEKKVQSKYLLGIDHLKKVLPKKDWEKVLLPKVALPQLTEIDQFFNDRKDGFQDGQRIYQSQKSKPSIRNILVEPIPGLTDKSNQEFMDEFINIAYTHKDSFKGTPKGEFLKMTITRLHAMKQTSRWPMFLWDQHTANLYSPEVKESLHKAEEEEHRRVQEEGQRREFREKNSLFIPYSELQKDEFFKSAKTNYAGSLDAFIERQVKIFNEVNAVQVFNAVSYNKKAVSEINEFIEGLLKPTKHKIDFIKEYRASPVTEKYESLSRLDEENRKIWGGYLDAISNKRATAYLKFLNKFYEQINFISTQKRNENQVFMMPVAEFGCFAMVAYSAVAMSKDANVPWTQIGIAPGNTVFPAILEREGLISKWYCGQYIIYMTNWQRESSVVTKAKEVALWDVMNRYMYSRCHIPASWDINLYFSELGVPTFTSLNMCQESAVTSMLWRYGLISSTCERADLAALFKGEADIFIKRNSTWWYLDVMREALRRNVNAARFKGKKEIIDLPQNFKGLQTEYMIVDLFGRIQIQNNQHFLSNVYLYTMFPKELTSLKHNFSRALRTIVEWSEKFRTVFDTEARRIILTKDHFDISQIELLLVDFFEGRKVTHGLDFCMMYKAGMLMRDKIPSKEVMERKIYQGEINSKIIGSLSTHGSLTSEIEAEVEGFSLNLDEVEFESILRARLTKKAEDELKNISEAQLSESISFYVDGKIAEVLGKALTNVKNNLGDRPEQDEVKVPFHARMQAVQKKLKIPAAHKEKVVVNYIHEILENEAKARHFYEVLCDELPDVVSRVKRFISLMSMKYQIGKDREIYVLTLITRSAGKVIESTWAPINKYFEQEYIQVPSNVRPTKLQQTSNDILTKISEGKYTYKATVGDMTKWSTSFIMPMFLSFVLPFHSKIPRPLFLLNLIVIIMWTHKVMRIPNTEKISEIERSVYKKMIDGGLISDPEGLFWEDPDKFWQGIMNKFSSSIHVARDELEKDMFALLFPNFDEHSEMSTKVHSDDHTKQMASTPREKITTKTALEDWASEQKYGPYECSRMCQFLASRFMSLHHSRKKEADSNYIAEFTQIYSFYGAIELPVVRDVVKFSMIPASRYSTDIMTVVSRVSKCAEMGCYSMYINYLLCSAQNQVRVMWGLENFSGKLKDTAYLDTLMRNATCQCHKESFNVYDLPVQLFGRVYLPEVTLALYPQGAGYFKIMNTECNFIKRIHCILSPYIYNGVKIRNPVLESDMEGTDVFKSHLCDINFNINYDTQVLRAAYKLPLPTTDIDEYENMSLVEYCTRVKENAKHIRDMDFVAIQKFIRDFYDKHPVYTFMQPSGSTDESQKHQLNIILMRFYMTDYKVAWSNNSALIRSLRLARISHTDSILLGFHADRVEEKYDVIRVKDRKRIGTSHKTVEDALKFVEIYKQKTVNVEYTITKNIYPKKYNKESLFQLICETVNNFSDEQVDDTLENVKRLILLFSGTFDYCLELLRNLVIKDFKRTTYNRANGMNRIIINPNDFDVKNSLGAIIQYIMSEQGHNNDFVTDAWPIKQHYWSADVEKVRKELSNLRSFDKVSLLNMYRQLSGRKSYIKYTRNNFVSQPLYSQYIQSYIQYQTRDGMEVVCDVGVASHLSIKTGISEPGVVNGKEWVPIINIDFKKICNIYLGLVRTYTENNLGRQCFVEAMKDMYIDYKGERRNVVDLIRESDPNFVDAICNDITDFAFYSILARYFNVINLSDIEAKFVDKIRKTYYPFSRTRYIPDIEPVTKWEEGKPKKYYPGKGSADFICFLDKAHPIHIEYQISIEDIQKTHKERKPYGNFTIYMVAGTKEFIMKSYFNAIKCIYGERNWHRYKSNFLVNVENTGKRIFDYRLKICHTLRRKTQTFVNLVILTKPELDRMIYRREEIVSDELKISTYGDHLDMISYAPIRQGPQTKERILTVNPSNVSNIRSTLTYEGKELYKTNTLFPVHLAIKMGFFDKLLIGNWGLDVFDEKLMSDMTEFFTTTECVTYLESKYEENQQLLSEIRDRIILYSQDTINEAGVSPVGIAYIQRPDLFDSEEFIMDKLYKDLGSYISGKVEDPPKKPKFSLQHLTKSYLNENKLPEEVKEFYNITNELSDDENLNYMGQFINTHYILFQLTETDKQELLASINYKESEEEYDFALAASYDYAFPVEEEADLFFAEQSMRDVDFTQFNDTEPTFFKGVQLDKTSALECLILHMILRSYNTMHSPTVLIDCLTNIDTLTIIPRERRNKKHYHKLILNFMFNKALWNYRNGIYLSGSTRDHVVTASHILLCVDEDAEKGPIHAHFNGFLEHLQVRLKSGTIVNKEIARLMVAN